MFVGTAMVSVGFQVTELAAPRFAEPEKVWRVAPSVTDVVDDWPGLATVIWPVTAVAGPDRYCTELAPIRW
ncbi:hypothetical protein [Frankia sp. AgB32]|uniref:hypothetical protein n=1 Tax=Frankia sp. AgB32 TaxID=631119 RepID=UPI00200FD3E7|nr:hypothetical protein [Frankia sp. AgB32]MCK9894574.1 hypothetical protein [Frankia sp. AgB32]